MNLRKIMKNIIIELVSIILWPIKYIIPKSDIIILHAHNLYVYCENTRFLYEHLSLNTNYKVYWVTESKIVMEYLDNKEFRYLTRKRIIHFIWTALRAKIIIDSGESYFNPFKLSNSNKTLKISTMHGSGPKVSHMRTNNINVSIQPILKLNKFDYVNFTSKYSITWVGKRLYLLPTKKNICFGYPRCDSYFNKDFVSYRYKKKKLAKEVNKNYNIEGKIILYTPTWRPYSYNIPILGMGGFNLTDFNNWLIEENIFLFFTAHSLNIPSSFPTNFSNIQYVEHTKHPLFDINLFMLEADILLNDYSTTSTDFALLKKPQIFYMPDYNYYYEEKGFVEDYKAILPGKEIYNYQDFILTIEHYLNKSDDYLNKYKNNIKILLERYYDVENKNSCEKFTEFIMNNN